MSQETNENEDLGQIFENDAQPATSSNSEQLQKSKVLYNYFLIALVHIHKRMKLLKNYCSQGKKRSLDMDVSLTNYDEEVMEINTLLVKFFLSNGLDISAADSVHLKTFVCC